jgi:hypothetical protein
MLTASAMRAGNGTYMAQNVLLRRLARCVDELIYAGDNLDEGVAQRKTSFMTFAACSFPIRVDRTMIGREFPSFP